jgi:hypothetical protein
MRPALVVAEQLGAPQRMPRIVLDGGRSLDWTVADMKTKILAGFTAMLVIFAAGCTGTVTGQRTWTYWFNRDTVEGRYDRSVDQVYQAAVQVIQTDGILLEEYIPHESTNTVRGLRGTVNNEKVWMSVQALDPQTTDIKVQARTKGGADIELAHQLEKEVALQLQSGSSR